MDGWREGGRKKGREGGREGRDAHQAKGATQEAGSLFLHLGGLDGLVPLLPQLSDLGLGPLEPPLPLLARQLRRRVGRRRTLALCHRHRRLPKRESASRAHTHTQK